MIESARLRRGGANSAGGAARFVADALITASKAAGATGTLLLRADSAYYGHDITATALRRGACLPVTARQDKAVRKAIFTIGKDAGTTINYTNALSMKLSGRAGRPTPRSPRSTTRRSARSYACWLWGQGHQRWYRQCFFLLSTIVPVAGSWLLFVAVRCGRARRPLWFGYLELDAVYGTHDWNRAFSLYRQSPLLILPLLGQPLSKKRSSSEKNTSTSWPATSARTSPS